MDSETLRYIVCIASRCSIHRIC